jgi:uncharacterized protein YbaR (Trm112 family)
VPISQELLEILCCPVTKSPVKPLPEESLSKLNTLISQGAIKDVEGNSVDKPVEEAIITEDSKTIYRIEDGIPVMLTGMGIPAEQLSNR